VQRICGELERARAYNARVAFDHNVYNKDDFEEESDLHDECMEVNRWFKA
jgi:hypothetical protein